ncbi:MAG: O-antigen ligase family protein [Desulfamplus sp.]|nr:O-antigen ligase family protein [Desulfamplus sp.]
MSIVREIPQERVSGFLTNPNNFALTAILLFFLIDFKGSSFSIKLLTHIIVVSIILASQTSGAVLGYLAGIGYYSYSFKIEAHKKILIVLLFLLFIITCIVTLYFNNKYIKAIDSTVKKIEVLKENYDTLISGKPVNYYTSVLEKKGDYTSALWRLNHWANILRLFFNSSYIKIFFGYGVGSTDQHFGIKSHNDYLRIIFEGGIISFLLNMVIWVSLYRQMDIESRWIIVIIAVYSITENNYDNFLVMSMIAFYMIGNRKPNEKLKNGIDA